MTLAEMVNTLVLRCGNRVGHESLLEAEVTSAIEELEESIFHPWFLLSGRTSIATEAGEERVNLPSDFLAEYEDGALWINREGQLEPLIKVSIQEIQMAEEAEGIPTHYAITGDLIRLYPAPDGEYTISMMYYQRSGTVDDSNVWFKYASQYVMFTAMKNYAVSVRDKNLLNWAEGMKTRWYDTLLARHTEHEVTNRDSVKGE